MSDKPLHMHKFYPKRQIFRNRSHVFIGESGTGKSTLVKDVMYNMPYIDYALAICPTHSSYLDFCDILPPAVVWEGTDLTPLVRLVETQKRILKEPGNKKARYLCVVLDDCIADDKVMKHPVIKDLLYNGRHYLMTVLFTTQYVMEIPKKVRKNVKYVYQLKDNTKEGLETLHNVFFGMLSKKRFKEVMDVNTENRGCVVLDKVTSSNDPEKCIFYYRANPRLPEFKVGCASMWRNCARFATSRGSNMATSGQNIINEVMHGMGMRGADENGEAEGNGGDGDDAADAAPPRHTSLIIEDIGPPPALRIS